MEDVSIGRGRPVRIASTLADGEEIVLEASPPRPPRRKGNRVPVLFLSAAQRAGALVERPEALTASRRRRRSCSSAHSTYALPGDRRAGPAISLVEAVEACCRARVRALVLLIEEPELYLRPQAQRYLYRLLRELVRPATRFSTRRTHPPS